MPCRAIIRRVVALVLTALIAVSSFAWESEGHRYINRVAAQHVPADMPGFFKAGVAWIEFLGPEPDQWRESTEPSLKNAQEPDHYLDLEELASFPPLPRKRYEFYRIAFEKRAAANIPANDPKWLPETIGLQPYITAEIYERLKVAFREYRALKTAGKPTLPAEQDAIFYAGWLGHYVGDGSQPMHASIHHHGWVGNNPNGYSTAYAIHSDFEGRFVRENLKPEDFAGLVQAPRHLADPWADYMTYLQHSNSLIEKTYQLEKAGAFAGRGTAEGREFVKERLGAASQMLLDLWYTAWIESGVLLPPRRPSPAAPVSNLPQSK